MVSLDDAKNMSLEQLLKQFIDNQSNTIEEQGRRMKNLETDVSLIAKQMNMIEIHLGQFCKFVKLSTKWQTPKYDGGDSKGPRERHTFEE